MVNNKPLTLKLLKKNMSQKSENNASSCIYLHETLNMYTVVTWVRNPFVRTDDHSYWQTFTQLMYVSLVHKCWSVWVGEGELKREKKCFHLYFKSFTLLAYLKFTHSLTTYILVLNLTYKFNTIRHLLIELARFQEFLTELVDIFSILISWQFISYTRFNMIIHVICSGFNSVGLSHKRIDKQIAFQFKLGIHLNSVCHRHKKSSFKIKLGVGRLCTSVIRNGCDSKINHNLGSENFTRDVQKLQISEKSWVYVTLSHAIANQSYKKKTLNKQRNIQPANKMHEQHGKDFHT